MKFFYLLNLLLLLNVYCLMPKKLPNGKILKFNPDKKTLINDLQILSPGQASLITKNWLENIVLDITNKKNNKDKDLAKNYFFEYDDLHIITSINKLEQYIQESFEKNDKHKNLFIAWYPLGIHGRREVLFIILVQLNIFTKEFLVKHLIQSPFWSSEQIDSIILKQTLIEQNKENNCTTINFDYLYENNLRYKLAWNIWDLDITE